MRLIILLLALAGCATTEETPVEVLTHPHLAKWCLEEDPTSNCTVEKTFADPMQCLLFLTDAPKKDEVGYWVCQLDPTREW